MNLYDKSLSLLVLEVLERYYSGTMTPVANVRNRITKSTTEDAKISLFGESFATIRTSFEPLYKLAESLFQANELFALPGPVSALFASVRVDPRGVDPRECQSRSLLLDHLLPHLRLEEAQALACTNGAFQKLVNEYRTDYARRNNLPALLADRTRQYVPMLAQTLFTRNAPITALDALPNNNFLMITINGNISWVYFTLSLANGTYLSFGFDELIIRRAIVCHDQSFVAISSNQILLHLVRDRELRLITTPVYDIHNDAVNKVIECIDRRVVTASEDMTLKVWQRHANGRGYTLQQTLLGHTAAVSDVVECNNGRRLVSIAKDGSIRVWKKNTDNQYEYHFRLTLSHQLGAALLVTRAGHLISAAGSKIEFWQQNANEDYLLAQSIECYTPVSGSMLESGDGTLIVNTGENGLMRFVRNGRRFEYAINFDSQRHRVTAMLGSPDGDNLVTGDDQGVVKCWTYRQPVQDLCFARKALGLFAPPVISAQSLSAPAPVLRS